jgi:peptidyl-prolyl cis-trans isomerase C
MAATGQERGTMGSKGRLGRNLAALAVVLSLAGVAACGRQDAQSRPPEPGDAAVASVDGRTIWASDVRREAVAQGVIGAGETLDANSELFHRMLDEVVDQKLLASEATRRNVESDPDVRRRLAAARERILGDVLVQKIVEQAVNDKTVRELYDERAKLSHPPDEFHARQIVAASQADAEATRKLIASGASFETLAGERSIDAATRFNGGDLGYFAVDVMPDAYEAALKPAKAGDIIGPFKSDAGWVLLKVEDRRPGQPLSLEQARPQIIRFATYDQVRDLLQTLRGKAKIALLTPPPAPPAKPPVKKAP